ncbi:DUF2922 family protein [Pseudoramibacter alactolyticus]|uniref:DUF2922 family protein n=1 Tax=Pseudoramibacter alactolyticus TaxID=113287 RepID=UPI0028D5D56F|nr:DUF2922 family protein [Pseudoramibacter alactolyticus]
METSRYLAIEWTTEAGGTGTLNLMDYKTDADDAAIKAALDTVVVNKLFAYDGSPIAAVKAASRVGRTVTPVALA